MILKYALLSDLHLGDGSLADNFRKKNWPDFTELIQKLWFENYIMVFVGDTCEAMQFHYSKIFESYPNLRQILANSLIVKGNHDIDISKHCQNEIYEYLELCDGKVLAYHGYQDDQPIGKGIVKAALKCWAVLERLLGRKITSWIQSDPISPQDPRYVGDKSEYVQKAKERALEQDCEIVVFGHTHSPGIFYEGERKVINTGTCQNGKLMYAIIEYDTELKKIIKYDLIFIK